MICNEVVSMRDDDKTFGSDGGRQQANGPAGDYCRSFKFCDSKLSDKSCICA